MISDKIAKASPYVGMINRANALGFVTEQVGSSFYMSLMTKDGTFKLLQFDTLEITTNMTAKFLGATSGLIEKVIEKCEEKIQNIIDEDD